MKEILLMFWNVCLLSIKIKIITVLQCAQSLKSEDRAFRMLFKLENVHIVLYIGCSGPVVECLNKINMLQSTTQLVGHKTHYTELCVQYAGSSGGQSA